MRMNDHGDPTRFIAALPSPIALGEGSGVRVDGGIPRYSPTLPNRRASYAII
jgi:hypothetical protein